MKTIKFVSGADNGSARIQSITSDKQYQLSTIKAGSGAFSQVNKLSDNRLVIKICNDNPHKYHIIRNEFNIYTLLATSQHENLSEMIDFAIIYCNNAIHHCFIFPDYGNSAHDLIEEYNGTHSVMPHSHALAISKGLARAVAHLHSLDIIHTDITPRNILLGCSTTDFGVDSVVKLADFGSACIEGYPVTSAAGTYEYCSPEIFKYESGESLPYTRKTDIWSAGATIFELYTGMYMFDLFGLCKTAYKWIPEHIYRGKDGKESSVDTNSSVASETYSSSSCDSGIFPDDEEYFKYMYELSKSRKKYKLFMSQFPSVPANISKTICMCVKYDPQYRISAAQLCEYLK